MNPNNENKQRIFSHIISNLQSDSRLALFCGHYQLVVDNDKTLPAIYQSLPDGNLRESLQMNPYSSEFPLESFSFGLNILEKRRDAKIVSLVNDWQSLPKNPHGAPDNPYRVDYYKVQSAGVPDIYLQELNKKGFGEEQYLQVPSRYRMYGNPVHFSEQLLRTRYSNHKHAMYSYCALDGGCAQEFLPFLEQVSEAGISELVAVIPGTCDIPIQQATRVAIKEAKLPITVWCVSIFDSLHLDTFWNNASVYKNGEYEMDTWSH